MRAPSVFAHNELVVAVPAANPADIKDLSQLSRAERIVIGMPDVPIGRYTRELLQRATASYGVHFAEQVMDRVVSEETNVRMIRSRILLGEADAAILYRTDVNSDGVVAVEIPEEHNVRVVYLIAPVHPHGQEDLAARWISYAGSEAGRRVLATHGFRNE